MIETGKNKFESQDREEDEGGVLLVVDGRRYVSKGCAKMLRRLKQLNEAGLTEEGGDITNIDTVRTS